MAAFVQPLLAGLALMQEHKQKQEQKEQEENTLASIIAKQLLNQNREVS